MKHLLFLMLISMFFFSNTYEASLKSTKFTGTTKVQTCSKNASTESESTKLSFRFLKRIAVGNFKDIAVNRAAVWTCDSRGRILSHKNQIIGYIFGNPPKRCKRIAVDYKGMPWVTSSQGLYRLNRISATSYKWQRIFKGKHTIDISCIQHKKGKCYFINGKHRLIWSFNSAFRVKTTHFRAIRAMKKLDVGRGPGGDVIHMIDHKKNVYTLYKNGSNKDLKSKAYDIACDWKNSVYLADRSGVYRKNNDENCFTQVRSEVAKRISVGNQMWVIGYDRFIYAE